MTGAHDNDAIHFSGKKKKPTPDSQSESLLSTHVYIHLHAGAKLFLLKNLCWRHFTDLTLRRNKRPFTESIPRCLKTSVSDRACRKKNRLLPIKLQISPSLSISYRMSINAKFKGSKGSSKRKCFIPEEGDE